MGLEKGREDEGKERERKGRKGREGRPHKYGLATGLDSAGAAAPSQRLTIVFCYRSCSHRTRESVVSP